MFSRGISGTCGLRRVSAVRKVDRIVAEGHGFLKGHAFLYTRCCLELILMQNKRSIQNLSSKSGGRNVREKSASVIYRQYSELFLLAWNEMAWKKLFLIGDFLLRFFTFLLLIFFRYPCAIGKYPRIETVSLARFAGRNGMNNELIRFFCASVRVVDRMIHIHLKLEAFNFNAIKKINITTSLTNLCFRGIKW